MRSGSDRWAELQSIVRLLKMRVSAPPFFPVLSFWPSVCVPGVSQRSQKLSF